MTQEEQLIELIKNKLPQLLREDEEFRTLFFGLMVQHLPSREEFTLILERLERFDTHAEERFLHIEERFLHIEERLERLETELVELRKEQVALREDFRAMQETIKAILQRLEGVETKQDALVEQVDSLAREMRAGFTEVHSDLGEVRGLSRLGIVSEEVLRNTLRRAVENWLGAGRVEHMELGGREVDVVIRDGQHVILEVTARAHPQDIDKLKASAKDYEQQFNIKPHLAIACAYATPIVIRRLGEAGIELISADLPE
jgi:hypothetical protein